MLVEMQLPPILRSLHQAVGRWCGSAASVLALLSRTRRIRRRRSGERADAATDLRAAEVAT